MVARGSILGEDKDVKTGLPLWDCAKARDCTLCRATVSGQKEPVKGKVCLSKQPTISCTMTCNQSNAVRACSDLWSLGVASLVMTRM